MIFDTCLFEHGNRIYWAGAVTKFDFSMAIDICTISKASRADDHLLCAKYWVNNKPETILTISVNTFQNTLQCLSSVSTINSDFLHPQPEAAAASQEAPPFTAGKRCGMLYLVRMRRTGHISAGRRFPTPRYAYGSEWKMNLHAHGAIGG